MNIFVCIKQVPATNQVEVDEFGVLKRDGVDSKMNPYDLYAIECAVRLKESHGGRVCVGTMGPMQAKEILKEAFMMGADDAVIFSDRKFGGADVLATAFTLSQGIASMGSFDVIVCGKQTTDGDTAQVGPSIAQYMGIPHVSWVTKIDEVKEQSMILSSRLQEINQSIEVTFPCLIAVEKDSFPPRLPSYRKKKASIGKEIVVKTLADFPCTDETKYGMLGSATQVERIFAPITTKEKQLFQGNVDATAKQLFDVLRQAKQI